MKTGRYRHKYNENRKKAASCAASFLMSLALIGGSLGADTGFSDLSEGPTGSKMLELRDGGIVVGVGQGLFAPQRSLSAAEGVQLLVKAFNLNLDAIRFIKEPLATDSFPKADNKAWYAQALIIASVHGMNLPSELDPASNWTREEFTYRLVSAMENYGGLPYIKIVLREISDEESLNIEYSGAVQRALYYGLTDLNKDGSFKPKDIITREEAAEQIYNALQYLKAHPAPDPGDGPL